jgi:hypothetical protein
MRCPVPQSRRLRIRGVKITGRPASPILADWGAAALGSPRGCAAASVEKDTASCGGVTAAPAAVGGGVTTDVAGWWPGQPAQSGPHSLPFLRHESHFWTAPFGRPTRPRPDVGAAGSRAGSASPAGAPGKRTRLEDAGARHRKGLCAWAEFCTLMLTCTGVRRIAHLHR